MSTINLHAPWWTRFAWPQWRRTKPHAQEPSYDELHGLDARTLRDIGAPDSMLARAHAHQEAQTQERDVLRLGIAAGAWRHW